MSIISHPHDKFFKGSLKEKQIALDFLKAHLPADIYQQLDLSTLRAIDKSYVSAELREVHSDMVYACQINGKAGYIPILLLLEHQSTASKHMAFRLLQYTVNLMGDHLKAGHNSLPLVLPICLYHGAVSPYPYSTDIFEDFDDVEMARALVFKQFQLIDLTMLPVDTLKQHGAASLMELLFKRYQERNFIETIRQLADQGILKMAISHTTESYFFAMLEYIGSNEQGKQPQKAEDLFKLLSTVLPEKRESIMTFNEQLRQEGERQKALAIAKKMLAEGSEPAFVKKVTGLFDEDIKKIAPQH
ncbi:Rpn family recombination-promoting nuclease/putative transposase [Mycoavidus sp. SF9855]|uniref:Rpn family recombination-promoting nuclease/putative transposase n=1 Tax=Mycoavidus sp. SF9855 TaxID=2968475 RepID=UPI00211B86F1|nr:Rpn family recombination-promoting nuclease/putative transposase [Mycoavidus sp. SF9855]UUM20751.1 Rpn family recombination-promoting nuclease/putative transposase [Mycoavidus sp. SF9855]